jgi:predicted TIM-barrel fold metal-dependent hydrolase
MMADLLFFLGPDRLIFGSDYGITSPKWIVEQFMAYQFPDELAQEAGTQLTMEVKRKILGLNAAKLYDIEVDPVFQLQESSKEDEGELTHPVVAGGIDVAA